MSLMHGLLHQMQVFEYLPGPGTRAEEEWRRRQKTFSLALTIGHYLCSGEHTFGTMGMRSLPTDLNDLTIQQCPNGHGEGEEEENIEVSCWAAYLDCRARRPGES